MSDGCDLAAFGEQVTSYLARAEESAELLRSFFAARRGTVPPAV